MPTGRVPESMKRLGITAVIAGAAVAIWLVVQRPPRSSAAKPEPTTTAAPAGTPAEQNAPAPDNARPIDKVTRLPDPETRRQLADRIASAQAARAAVRAAPIPRLPEQDAGVADEPQISKTEIRDAMRELIPHLVQCYEEAIPLLESPDFEMTAELTLTGDPDIGTIVDARELSDATGKRLPAKVDDCFRSTFQLMALPPLAGDSTIEVRYPFVFRTN